MIALDSGGAVQFVLRVYQEGEDGGSYAENKNKSSHSFFKAMKKKLAKPSGRSKEVES